MCCVMITSQSRPGRPPKRVLPFPAPSPQDAMLQLNRSPLVPQDNFSRRTLEDLDGGRFPGGPGGGSFPGGHPMTAAGAAHLMSLNNPAALLSRTGNGYCHSKDVSWHSLQECCQGCPEVWGRYQVCPLCMAARATPSWRLTSSSMGTLSSIYRGKWSD